MGRFYSYLLLFQGAMVGIVLSDNILMLLVFWDRRGDVVPVGEDTMPIASHRNATSAVTGE